MGKRLISSYIIIFMMICQVFVSIVVVLPVSAASEEQENAIKERCDDIKDDLKKVQKSDARARVHLGGKYETILTKFIVPLNVKLVEVNLSTPELVENQNNFVEAKTLFNDDYISYQQKLEELVATDCEKEPGDFYEKLVKVRQKRKTMEQDVMRIRTLITQHVNLVNGLKGKV